MYVDFYRRFYSGIYIGENSGGYMVDKEFSEVNPYESPQTCEEIKENHLMNALCCIVIASMWSFNSYMENMIWLKVVYGTMVLFYSVGIIWNLIEWGHEHLPKPD